MAGESKIEKQLRKRRRNAVVSSVTGMSAGRRKNDEHKIQVQCVRWMKQNMPELYKVTFAVPNGGLRDEITMASLIEEGLTPGVADIIVLKSNRKYGSLCIEMKTPKGGQSRVQKQWQKDCELIGAGCYRICRSLEDFKRAVLEYCIDINVVTDVDAVIVRKAKMLHDAMLQVKPAGETAGMVAETKKRKP